MECTCKIPVVISVIVYMVIPEYKFKRGDHRFKARS